MRVETITLNEERNVTLTAYIQEAGGEFKYVTKRPAVLILPGGAYRYCSDREADPVAMSYLKAGYQAFILRYSVKEDAVWPNPLNDYEQAMELIRSKEEEWALYGDKIAVIGFSAGGHLAAAAATMSKNRPNAAILGYAVASEDVKGCNPTAPSAVAAVDKDTCPCFVFASRTDNVVPISNSLDFMSALAKSDIAFESHIYGYGPHGFSTCDPSIQSKDTAICERVPNWVEDSIGWLRDVLGEFGEACMTEPVCKVHMTGDYEDFLSLDCTVGRLLDNPQSGPTLKAMLEEMAPNTMLEGIDLQGEAGRFLRKLRLRDALDYVPVTPDFVVSLDEKLKKIPNI